MYQSFLPHSICCCAVFAILFHRHRPLPCINHLFHLPFVVARSLLFVLCVPPSSFVPPSAAITMSVAITCSTVIICSIGSTVIICSTVICYFAQITVKCSNLPCVAAKPRLFLRRSSCPRWAVVAAVVAAVGTAWGRRRGCPLVRGT